MLQLHLSYQQFYCLRCDLYWRFYGKCFLSHLAVVFAQSIEARCLVENEDVVGAAAIGDAPTASE